MNDDVLTYLRIILGCCIFFLGWESGEIQITKDCEKMQMFIASSIVYKCEVTK
jgi:hypothetical protein